ncbi:MAG: UDP-3-O-acyl-N-acetylglucosamine deacetylase [Limimaricola sp.]|uniref:UDP-3-O-acyl-N-acetylglucosamine deacetylase n=1 Tax=Limimaricola sp. TaxID=2211665 RepID=UPI001D9A7845|nr:UDP-3-O-acyl-N-acetylglucosamine deacetylase [Limimaricola sp.]MBI1418568.1 UDP-3-O-acyl-N-acetylglucosamine deacetylase [Limimaricola sp.]
MQTTIRQVVRFAGVGLHRGRPARLVLRPAPADHGIVFCRVDAAARGALLPARWDMVEQTPLNTRLRNADGVSVATVEHLMAALAGCGLHNVLVEIDGPEVPILDGSAAPFVRAILAAGVQRLAAPLRVMRMLQAVEVRRGAAVARLEPADRLRIDFRIDFADAAIGQQELALDMANGAFVRELCSSRTFCRQADVDAMRAKGLALGGTLENAVVVDGDQVLSPGGLRQKDEAVRHKMLDAMGDLATAGAPIIGRYTGHRAGHALTNALLRAVMERPETWTWDTCTPDMERLLPGASLHAADLAAVA